MPSDLIPLVTVESLVEAYESATRELRIAFTHFQSAQESLNRAFTLENYSRMSLWPVANSYCSYEDFGDRSGEKILLRVKKEAWTRVVKLLNLKKYLSQVEEDKLDRQLDKPEDLPEFTMDNIIAMAEKFYAQRFTYIADAVREVYESLRPYTSYKTNSQFRLKEGVKVILPWLQNDKWNAGRISLYHSENIRRLDNLFHMLDGKIFKTYWGPLYEGLEREWEGETEYFKFKKYQNGNVHLWFKRQDLINRMNDLAGFKELE